MPGVRHLFDRDASGDRHQRRSRAAGVPETAGAWIDGVKPDVEAEREMAFREPACADAVIDGLQPLVIPDERLLAIGHDRPDRLPYAAADVAPPVAVPEIQRHLAVKRAELFGDRSEGGPGQRRLVRPRRHGFRADADGDDLDLDQIDMR